jgi:hypothetical protein
VFSPLPDSRRIFKKKTKKKKPHLPECKKEI